MPSKSQSILLGGAATGVLVTLLSLVPVVGSCVGCLGYIGAGMAVVWHYTNTHGLTIESGSGAGMGALGGVVAALVGTAVYVLLNSLGLAPGFEEVMQGLIDSGALQEEQLEAVEGIFNSPLIYVFQGVAGAIIGAILGAIGGAIGASVFKKGEGFAG